MNWEFSEFQTHQDAVRLFPNRIPGHIFDVKRKKYPCIHFGVISWVVGVLLEVSLQIDTKVNFPFPIPTLLKLVIKKKEEIILNGGAEQSTC